MVAYCQHCRQRRCVGCLTGFLGCRWRGYEQSSGNSTLCDVFWLLFFFCTGLYVWFWFYYWLLAENSMEMINGYAFAQLGTWFPFYFVMLALTCAALVYIIILFSPCIIEKSKLPTKPLLLAHKGASAALLLFHFIVDFQLYIHWIHRVILVVILLMAVVATVGLDILWSDGWRLMHISLMITAPFLHICGVIVATLASWFVAGYFMRQRASNKKPSVVGAIWFIVYVVAMIALYISPLTIKSPCIIEKSKLPTKPLLLAHKGASAIAPENTLIAFDYAADNGVFAFESDVIISNDGIPFILHDKTFRRTTNIADVFPELTDVEACRLNMSDIKQLDAGSWFLRDDPYGTVKSRSLSDATKKLYSNQTIPTLTEMLQLALARNVSVMFDIKALDESMCKGHPLEDQYGRIVVDTIHQLGFPNDKMWWLYYKSINTTTSFHFVSASLGQSVESLYEENATTVNFGFSTVTWNSILYYLEHNIWVNLYTIDSKWLYSLYWCMNVTSITTNRSPEFAKMSSPVWHMAPRVYLTVWIAVDCVSAVVVILFWIFQRILHRRLEVDSDSYSLQPAPTATSTYRPETMHQQLINVENC